MLLKPAKLISEIMNVEQSNLNLYIPEWRDDKSWIAENSLLFAGLMLVATQTSFCIVERSNSDVLLVIPSSNTRAFDDYR